MKKFLTITIVVLMVSIGLHLDSTTNKIPISQSSIVKVSGTIKAVMTEIPAGQDSQNAPVAFTKLKITNPTAKLEYIVQVAPGLFLKSMGMFLKKDDKINIVGYRVPGSKDIKSITIEIRGRILPVRDRFGKGLWEKPEASPKKTGMKVR